MKRAVLVLANLAGLWLYVFLWFTPRGDRILDRVGKILFPDRITQ